MTVDVSRMLNDREGCYGTFSGNAAYAQNIKRAMKRIDRAKWESLSDDQREALDMIAHKIARILNGDPNYQDNWIDIAGYAQLVANRLAGETK